MNNHTPGPWHMGPMSKTVRPEPFNTLNGGFAIAEVFGKDRPSNARAISALPELVEALSEFAFQHYCGCNHPACNDCQRDKLAREALKKAGCEYPGATL